MTVSALCKTNVQTAWGGVVGESWIGSESHRLSATVVLSLYLHCPLDKMPPLFFFFSWHAIVWFLRWKITFWVLHYRPQKGGPPSFASCAHRSLFWADSARQPQRAAAAAPHPPQSVSCHINGLNWVGGRFNGYHLEQNQSREGMAREKHGWGLVERGCSM